MPTLIPPAPNIAAGAEVAELDSRALIRASVRADTVSVPATSSGVFWMYARVRAGFSPSNAVEMSGSPRIASMSAKNVLVGFQPRELKASVTPTDVAPEAAATSVVASRCERFSAATVRSPAVVVTSLSTMKASALLSTRLVASAPVPAMESPWPSHELPPEDVAVASACARITACSTACTRRSPTSSTASVTEASTALRTSLRTTRPPMPTESEFEKLKPWGTISVTGMGFHQPRSV